MHGLQKILLVDDEFSVLSALRRLFRRSEYQIFTASSAREGLQLLKEQAGAFSLVITDYRMPDMNGVEFLCQVSQQWPEIVRIVLSGYADTEAIISATNEGHIYKFISKPWDEDFLLQAVEAGLAKYRKDLLLQRQQEFLVKEIERLEQLKSTNLKECTGNQLQTIAVYQVLLDQMPVGVVGIDCFGDVVCMNSCAQGLLGLEIAPLGESICNILPVLCNKTEGCNLLQGICNTVLDINGKKVQLMVKRFCQNEDAALMLILVLV